MCDWYGYMIDNSHLNKLYHSEYEDNSPFGREFMVIWMNGMKNRVLNHLIKRLIT